MPTPDDLEFNWCVPVSGDGHQVGLPEWERPATLDYGVAIFECAARHGLRYLLLGMGFNNHLLEAWTYGTALLARTPHAGAMIAVRPGFYSAPVLAKMAGTLDHLSGGRLALNIVSGGRVGEQAMFGDFLEHEARYRRTREFMEICRLLWKGTRRFDYTGEFYGLKRTVLEQLPLQPGGPRFYFGGASEMAAIVGAELTDVYLLWGETLGQTAQRLQDMKRRVAEAGREGEVRYGLRVNLVSRPTEQEAREAARHIIAAIPPEKLERVRHRDLETTGRDSVGQRRQWELLARSDEEFYVEPHLWAGISIARSGAGMAIVGSHEQVAERLLAYVALGIRVFIFSGYPHLEECENVGQNVLPLLRMAAGSGR